MAQNEIRLMEAAVAVAEELNFSRAAQRLRISQPALTRRIADLESRFTLILFERDSKTVCLTDAGRAFVEHARLSILHSERAVQAARAAQANADTVLRVGKTPYGDPFLVTTLLSLRLPLYPRLRVELSSGYPSDLVHDLLSGRIDLALVTDPPDTAALSMMKVAEEPFYVALSEDNVLADCPELKLSELDECPWAVLAKAARPVSYDALLRIAADRAIHPSELHEVLAPEEAYPYIAERNGFALLTKSAALHIARDGITLRPLAEQRLTLRTYLASRSDNEAKATAELVRAFGRKLSELRSSS